MVSHTVASVLGEVITCDCVGNPGRPRGIELQTFRRRGQLSSRLPGCVQGQRISFGRLNTPSEWGQALKAAACALFFIWVNHVARRHAYRTGQRRQLKLARIAKQAQHAAARAAGASGLPVSPPTPAAEGSLRGGASSAAAAAVVLCSEPSREEDGPRSVRRRAAAERAPCGGVGVWPAVYGNDTRLPEGPPEGPPEGWGGDVAR